MNETKNKYTSVLSLLFGKKAPKYFEKHQETNCHKAASALETVVTKCADVAELTNKSIVESRKVERNHLTNVIRCLRFLAMQGITIQGNTGEDNFSQLLMLLGTKDQSITSTPERIRLKYRHSDIQNELFDLMAQQVLREKLKEIIEHDFFTIMADEYTDISNLDQLSM